MKQKIMEDIVQQMLPYLDNAQLHKLQEVLEHSLFEYEIAGRTIETEDDSQELINSFVYAKRIEGCSEKSLKYYKATIEAMLCELKKDVKHIVTDDIRGYLTEYQEKKKSSKDINSDSRHSNRHNRHKCNNSYSLYKPKTIGLINLLILKMFHSLYNLLCLLKKI